MLPERLSFDVLDKIKQTRVLLEASKERSDQETGLCLFVLLVRLEKKCMK